MAQQRVCHGGTYAYLSGVDFKVTTDFDPIDPVVGPLLAINVESDEGLVVDQSRIECIKLPATETERNYLSKIFRHAEESERQKKASGELRKLHSTEDREAAARGAVTRESAIDAKQSKVAVTSTSQEPRNSKSSNISYPLWMITNPAGGKVSAISSAPPSLSTVPSGNSRTSAGGGEPNESNSPAVVLANTMQQPATRRPHAVAPVQSTSSSTCEWAAAAVPELNGSVALQTTSSHTTLTTTMAGSNAYYSMPQSQVRQLCVTTTSSDVLRPVPIYSPPSQKSQNVPPQQKILPPREPIRIEDFDDYANSSPFDSVALTSLNDIEELKAVLDSNHISDNSVYHNTVTSQLQLQVPTPSAAGWQPQQ